MNTQRHTHEGNPIRTNGLRLPNAFRQLASDLKGAAGKALHVIKPNSLGVYRRFPFIDEECPEVSDIDLISFWSRSEEKPERLSVLYDSKKFFVDILWVPFWSIVHVAEAVKYGMLPNLLRESKVLWVRSDTTGSLVNAIRRAIYRPSAWQLRIGSQLDLGNSALSEARRNVDYPPATLFFAQMAHSYYTAAIADSLKLGISSVLTHPINRLRTIDEKTGQKLAEIFLSNLSLTGCTPAPFQTLRRMHKFAVSDSLVKKPRGMGMRTWWHYLYSISPLELEYREIVAETMNRRNSFASANLYVRFWAYSIARCLIVSEEIREGKNPSFYVPFEPLRNSIQRSCPEALEEFTLAFGEETTEATARDAMSKASDFRAAAVKIINRRGFLLANHAGSDQTTKIEGRPHYSE